MEVEKTGVILTLWNPIRNHRQDLEILEVLTEPAIEKVRGGVKHLNISTNKQKKCKLRRKRASDKNPEVVRISVC